MNLGGLVFESFKIVFGNSDVMFAILTWAIFLSIALTSLAVYQYLRR